MSRAKKKKKWKLVYLADSPFLIIADMLSGFSVPQKKLLYVVALDKSASYLEKATYGPKDVV